MDDQFQAGKMNVHGRIHRFFSSFFLTVVEDSLKEIKTQTNEALDSVSEQSKKVEESLTSLETVLKDLKDGDEQRDEEFKNVKEEVESLKELVPKMLDRNKDAQSAVLNDLQNEIKSLKSLLLSRRAPGSSLLEQGSSNTAPAPASPSTSTTPTTAATTAPATTEGLSPRLSAAFNSSSARPGIPAWQMAAANKSSSSSTTENKSATEPVAATSSSSSSS
ncbi:unnamed protein product [Absidia cylindrospora]